MKSGSFARIVVEPPVKALLRLSEPEPALGVEVLVPLVVRHLSRRCAQTAFSDLNPRRRLAALDLEGHLARMLDAGSDRSSYGCQAGDADARELVPV